jgi:hypothetical protein
MDFFAKLLDYIGFDKIIVFFQELFDFYFKPKMFYRNFFAKKGKEKLLQIFCYGILLVGIAALLLDNMSFRELAQALVIEISTLFVIVIIISLSTFIISNIWEYDFHLDNIISFCILTKLLIAPICVVFFGFFINRENYNYFFIYNCLNVLLTIYIFLFPPIIFIRKKWAIIACMILNFVLFNITEFVAEKMSIDKFSTLNDYYVDQIMKERLEVGATFRDFYATPYKRILLKSKEGNISFFTFATPLDSTASGSFESTDSFHMELERKIDTLNARIPNLKFERNKLFFEKTRSLYKSMDSLLNQEVIRYTEADIESRVVYLTKDSTELYKKIILPVSNTYSEQSYELLRSELEMESKSTYAMLPFKCYKFLYPLPLLTASKDSTQN